MVRELLPIPAVIDPPTTIYICVPVPNQEEHRAAFLGMILNLAQWVSWARDDAHSAALVADVWKPIFQCVLDQMREYPAD